MRRMQSRKRVTKEEMARMVEVHGCSQEVGEIESQARLRHGPGRARKSPPLS